MAAERALVLAAPSALASSESTTAFAQRLPIKPLGLPRDCPRRVVVRSSYPTARMSPAADAKSADSDADDVLPSSGGLRTALSLLLVVHFLALFVAIASNAGPPSPLRQAFRNVPGAVWYLQALHMDLGYDYHQTYDDQLDYDHFAQIEIGGSSTDDGDTAVIDLPTANLRPGIRQRRYLNLTRSIASRAAQEEIAGLLPLAVARTMLAEKEIDSDKHRFRCRFHAVLAPEDLESPNPEDKDPYHSSLYETIYEADLFFADGELQLIKTAGRRETAPVRQSGKRAAETQPE